MPSVRVAPPAPLATQMGLKAQKHAEADTEAFAGLLGDETLAQANATKAPLSAAQTTAGSRKTAGFKAKPWDAGADESDAFARDQTQADPSNIAFCGAAPVLFALAVSSGDTISPSGAASEHSKGAAARLERPSAGKDSASALSNASAQAACIPQAFSALPDGQEAAALRSGQQNAALAAVDVTVKTHLAPSAAPSVAAALKAIAPEAAQSADSARKAFAAPASQNGESAVVQESGDTAAPVRPTPVSDFSCADKRGQDGSSSHERSAGDERSGAAAAPPPSPTGIGLPVGSSSASDPSPQIFQAIDSAAPQASSEAALADAGQYAQQPVKTIALALAPQNLGSVSIELSLKSGKLDVKVTAAEPETAKLLQRDDAALGNLLHSAGYSVESISIQVSAQAAQPGQTGQGSADPPGSNRGGREQGNRQGSNDQPANRGSDQRPSHGRTADISGGGSLYV